MKTKVCSNIMCFLNFMLFVMIVFIISLCANLFTIKQLQSQINHKVATVNMTQIIDEFITAHQKESSNPKQLKTETQQFAQSLQATIQDLSRKKHLIILPSEAVLAGSYDITSLVRQSLSKKINSEANGVNKKVRI